MSRLLFFIIFLLYSGHSFAIEDVTLKDYKMVEEGNELSIIFKFEKEVKYHSLLLKNPDRFVLDLDHVFLNKQLTSSDNSIVKGVRTNDHDHKFLRLVFDLKQKVRYKTAYSADKNELTITLNSEEKNCKAIKESDPPIAAEEALASASTDASPTKLSKHLELPPEPALKLDNHKKSKNIIVVIDPGHGGKDPGAAGVHGTVEKEVVLKISKKLQMMLNEEPGFCAVLTRATDCYIPLRKRLAIARQNHADMFIAIHADAYHHSHATGASVYALSQRGATSEAAKWLAEKENESELGGLSSELADKDAILRSVLIDLSQTHTIESSLQIGNTVLGNLGKLSRLHHPKVEQAAFVVLKSPDIPSILVETGFLSNPEEEEKLTDPDYQYQSANAIKEGIKQYFLVNSPGGTWFSENHSRSQNHYSKHSKH